MVRTNPGEVIAPDALKEVRNEGMPIAGRPYEHGSLYIEFSVKFPESLLDTQSAAIKAALGAGLPPPVVPPGSEAVPATMIAASPEHISFDEGRHAGHGAQNESDDEEAPQGVQCAQQ